MNVFTIRILEDEIVNISELQRGNTICPCQLGKKQKECSILKKKIIAILEVPNKFSKSNTITIGCMPECRVIVGYSHDQPG